MEAFLKTLTGKILVIGSLIGAISTLFINFIEFNKSMLGQNVSATKIEFDKAHNTTNNIIVLPNNKVNQEEIEGISQNGINEEISSNTTRYLPNVTGR